MSKTLEERAEAVRGWNRVFNEWIETPNDAVEAYWKTQSSTFKKMYGEFMFYGSMVQTLGKFAVFLPLAASSWWSYQRELSRIEQMPHETIPIDDQQI